MNQFKFVDSGHLYRFTFCYHTEIFSLQYSVAEKHQVLCCGAHWTDLIVVNPVKKS